MTAFSLTEDQIAIRDMAQGFASETLAPHAVRWDEEKHFPVEEMRAAAASMNAILNELPLHVGYCAQWGISEPEMAAQPEAPETLNYTRYVLDIGHSGDALDLLVALMPCVAGYAEIGLGLLQHPATRLDDNPYASWIRNYGDEGYLQGVSAALALLETVWQQRGSEARITELSEIFTTATRLEAQFWQMGLNATAETRA